jgi:hypothetical protein
MLPTLTSTCGQTNRITAKTILDEWHKPPSNENKQMTNERTNSGSWLFSATILFSLTAFCATFGYALATGLSDTAKLTIGIVTVVLLIALPFIAVLAWLLYRPPATTTQIREVHDSEYRPAQRQRYLPAAEYEQEYRPISHENRAYRPPAAREVFIPRYAENGAPKPYGFDSAATSTLATNDDTGQRITVDARLLSRFLQCQTPSRKEWTGGTEGYTAASAFCCEQGMTIKLANGGQRWRPEYQDEDTRLEWAQSLTV